MPPTELGKPGDRTVTYVSGLTCYPSTRSVPFLWQTQTAGSAQTSAVESTAATGKGTTVSVSGRKPWAQGRVIAK